MSFLIAVAIIAPFAAGLGYALTKQDWTVDRPRKDGYANAWAAQKGERPHSSRHRY